MHKLKTMKLSKTTLLIAALLLLLFIVFIVRFFFSRPIQKTNKGVQESKIGIVSTNITGQPIGISEFIKIRFNKPFNPKLLNITLQPPTEFTTHVDPSGNELVIEPKLTWVFDTVYVLKISNQEQAGSIIELDKNYQFTFITVKYSGM